VERDDEEIVKMLLDKGAKLDTIVGDRTPLSIAKQEGNPKIIALL
jgi:ankyrin repeat protein